jgi:hypothetical protein
MVKQHVRAQRLANVDPRADGATRDVTIARHLIRIERRLHGIRMVVELPAQAYEGVVLSADTSSAACTAYRVELRHRDPDLAVTLFETADDREAPAVWADWAAFFALPQLTDDDKAASGRASALHGARRNARQRRRGAAISKRRPSALARRKPGQLTRAHQVYRDERVIIAYE